MTNYKILVINSGSSSIKYRLFKVKANGNNNGAHYSILSKGLIEKIGQKGSGVENHKQGIQILLDGLVKGENAKLKGYDEIFAVGHRVVHGGVQFKKPIIITDTPALPFALFCHLKEV